MNDLLNGTLAEAMEKLARYAAALRTAPRTATEKAASASDFLASVGEQFKKNPTLGSSLAGAGIGAGLGGLSTAWGNRGKDEGSKKGLMGSILTGGLAGAGVGAGISAAKQGLEGIKGQGTMGDDALRKGEFVDPATGQKMVIDPKALKDNPELHKQVKSLTTPSTQSRVAGGVGGFLKTVHDSAPITSTMAAVAAPIDLALHNPLFGLARTTPEAAGGYWGKKFLSTGAENAKNIPDALKAVLTGNDRVQAGSVDLGPGIKAKAGKGVTEILGNQGSLKGDDAALRLTRPQTQPVEVSDPHTGRKWTQTEPVLDAHGAPVNDVHEINKGRVSQLKGLGAEKTKYFEDRQMFKLPGTNKVYRGMAGAGGALGLRAGLYGIPMATEYMIRGMQEDMQNKQTLRELMQQHAKPVPEGK